MGQYGLKGINLFQQFAYLPLSKNVLLHYDCVKTKPLSSSLKLEPFAALCIARAHITVGLRRRGGHISAVFSLFVLLSNTNFMNKFKFTDFSKNKNKIQFIDGKFLFQSTKST